MEFLLNWQQIREDRKKICHVSRFLLKLRKNAILDSTMVKNMYFREKLARTGKKN
jgi:hypothetical protein